jgi:hypothetical protein
MMKAKAYLDDDLPVGHHHGDTPEQSLQVLWELLASSVARVLHRNSTKAIFSTHRQPDMLSSPDNNQLQTVVDY